MVDLLTNILNSLTSSGYTVTGSSPYIVTKSGGPIETHFSITGSSPFERIEMRGARSGIVFSGSYHKVFQPTNGSATPFDWPINWECFVHNNPDEVYVILNYQGDHYQHLGFGDSPAPGSPECMWIHGSCTGLRSESVAMSSSINWRQTAETFWSIGSNTTNGGLDSCYFCPSGSFYNHLSATWVTAHNNNTTSGAAYHRGQLNYSALLYCPPSNFTTTPLLVPIRLTAPHPEGGINMTIVGSLKHSRLVRIDNHLPEDVLVYGAENWKVYPMLRRDATTPRPFANVPHSGTLGVAIRNN